MGTTCSFLLNDIRFDPLFDGLRGDKPAGVEHDVMGGVWQHDGATGFGVVPRGGFFETLSVDDEVAISADDEHGDFGVHPSGLWDW